MKVKRSKQMTIFHYDLNKIVKDDHPLKKIDKLISFSSLVYRIKNIETEVGRNGYGLEVALRCVFLQYYYDLSDRQLEDALRYNMAMRWFCGFEIDERTPDHSFFGRARKAIGTNGIHKILKAINHKAKDVGILKNLFTFADASAIIAKETTWAERDKALADGEEKLNNENIEDYSADKDAKFGCKGKSKYWFGYKRNAAVDMSSGLIKTVAVTPANVQDDQAFKHICPYDSIIFGDKAYALRSAQLAMKANFCQSAAILKNNMLGKNRDLDRWRSGLRSPFENIFSKLNNRTRYRGLVKTQFQAAIEAIIFNTKRLLTMNAPPLFAGA
jgi:transposase, IS5 family